MLRLIQFYLLTRHRRMSLSPEYRNLLNREMKIYSIIQKSFKKQRKFLEENVEDLYSNYKYNIQIEYANLNDEIVHIYPDKKNRFDVENNEPLWWFRRAMWLEEMIESLKPHIKKSVEKWYKMTYRLFEPLLEENWFSYYTDVISNYANHRWELNLSNYKWAISRTTKFDVIKILKEWIDNNLTPWEVAKQIESIDERLFWKPRARTIAITEMRKAYEYWNYQPISQLESVWIQMMKKRQTCDDSKVRPEHMECELEWRVRSDYEYPSVWTKYPPWWPNCRCTMLYQRAK